MEDTLLKSDGSLRHHGELPDSDEELSPSHENLIVLTWLRLINRRFLLCILNNEDYELINSSTEIQL